MKELFILAAKRTPIGSFGGSLSTVSAPHLGAEVVKACLEEVKIEKKEVDECIMGHVLTAGVGQAPARQTALLSGLEKSTPCLTVNKVCGSGLKAVMLGCDQLLLEKSKLVVAGGQENMSLCPHLLEGSRKGYKMGDFKIFDSMVKDGLTDPFYDFHMGNAAEICSREHKISRKEQDEFAIESYKKAIQSQKEGLFKKEMVPLEVSKRKEKMIVKEDEEPSRVKFDKIPTLNPAFEKEGTITPANASKINDGASSLILSTKEFAEQKGIQPLCRILGYATFAQDPKWFTTAPIEASRKVLKYLKKEVSDIDLWEINEAFSVVALACQKELKVPEDKLNVHGGSVALGHPIGASGARILTTLVHALKARKKSLGLAAICLGGGEACALVVENI